MHRPLTSSARSFAADERGNVAVMFALMSTVILLVAGIAIDYARTVNMNSRIGAAADAATLAAGRAMLDGKLNDARCVSVANSYLQHNAEAGGAMPGNYSAAHHHDRTATSAPCMSISASRVPTTLTRIAGLQRDERPGFDRRRVRAEGRRGRHGARRHRLDDRKRRWWSAQDRWLKFAFRRFVEQADPRAHSRTAAKCASPWRPTRPASTWPGSPRALPATAVATIA